MIPPGFQFHPQRGPHDCGPACLRMVASVHGITHIPEPPDEILVKGGLNLREMLWLAERGGLRGMAHHWRLGELLALPVLPCIVLLRQAHYAVLVAGRAGEVALADPSPTAPQPIRWISEADFQATWHSPGQQQGVALTFAVL